MFSVRTFKNMKKGFTLIELMVVIAVIAILATISLFGLRSAQGSARNTQRKQIMNSVRAALERYYGDKNSYISGSDFSAMVTTLTGANYLVGLPVDPGCGGGASTFPGTVAVNWAPCNAGGGVTYSYTGVAAAYTLTLTKESGGSNTFSGPQ